MVQGRRLEGMGQTVRMAFAGVLAWEFGTVARDNSDGSGGGWVGEEIEETKADADWRG